MSTQKFLDLSGLAYYNSKIQAQLLEKTNPSEFSSDEPISGGIAELVSGLDLTLLGEVYGASTPTIGDRIVFENGYQAIIAEINDIDEEYDAIISRVPSETNFESIAGDPLDNDALANALNLKLNANLGDANEGKYLRVDSTGAVTVDDILAISESEIDSIMA